ncbi:Vta1 like-domain-containing protein [Syncephalis plumigaleata]|nr:Vta1 like-domain-containing protein [Syncephalis plumigaleata]
MSSMSIPADLKFISPFLTKGNEMQTHDAVIAYFCNVYAAQLAVEKGVTDTESRAFLIGLLERLEQVRKGSIGGHEALENKTVSKAYVEQFALNIFKRADDEDRAAKSNANTARSFQAASVFLETCSTFGELDEDIAQKIKYAKWRALEIIKAIKSGQPVRPVESADTSTSTDNEIFTVTALPPVAGLLHDRTESTITPNVNTTDNNISSSSSNTTSPVVVNTTPTSPIPIASISSTATTATTTATAMIQNQTTHTTSASLSATTTTTTATTAATTTSLPDHKIIAATQKHAKFAVSALQYEDITTAVSHLQQALDLLQPYISK